MEKRSKEQHLKENGETRIAGRKDASKERKTRERNRTMREY